MSRAMWYKRTVQLSRLTELKRIYLNFILLAEALTKYLENTLGLNMKYPGPCRDEGKDSSPILLPHEVSIAWHRKEEPKLCHLTYNAIHFSQPAPSSRHPT